MTKRITGIFAMGALVALAALAFNPAAMAANHGQGHGQGHGVQAGAQMGGCSGWGGAALTPEQQEKAQALFNEFQQKTATLHRELYARQAMLNAELVALTPDAKRVDALVTEVSALRTKLFTERVALRKALTEAGLPAMGMGGKHGGKRGGMMMGCN